MDGRLLGPGQPDLLPKNHEDSDNHEDWAKAANAVGGITPFEAKALYATGLVRHLLEGAGRCLIEPPFHLPAYVITAEACEALGRCLIGDIKENHGSGKRLEEGLRAAMAPDGKITTLSGTYDMEACAGLRHFATHGGTTPRLGTMIDPQLITALIKGLADALERFWFDLHEEGEYVRDKLARALLRPLWTGRQPIFVPNMKDHIENGGTPGISLMYECTWRCQQ
jgi:hypothetical protein